MSRRAAAFTQADAYRMGAAAKRLGPEWRVVLDDGKLNLVQDPLLDRAQLPVSKPHAGEEPALDARDEIVL